MLFLIIIAIILIVFVAMSVKIVRQSEVYIIERLGKFHKIADAGLTIIIPFIDHVRSIVSLKQQTLDVAPQEVITKDNVTITINTVVFYRIMDPAKAVYEIQSLKKGIEYLSVTSIRDLVGKMDLDSTFSSERNKRAAILQAEGERQAAVLKAQGEKEAAILQADADRESKIRRAVGEAEAIRKVAEAKADEVKLVYGAMMKANPNETLVQLKSLEALKDVANGEANKVFIPFEATQALSSVGAISDILKDKKEVKK